MVVSEINKRKPPCIPEACGSILRTPFYEEKKIGVVVDTGGEQQSWILTPSSGFAPNVTLMKPLGFKEHSKSLRSSLH